MFFKVINKKQYTIKKGLKRLSGLYAALYIRELVNCWFRFFDVTNRLFICKVLQIVVHLPRICKLFFRKKCTIFMYRRQNLLYFSIYMKARKFYSKAQKLCQVSYNQEKESIGSGGKKVVTDSKSFFTLLHNQLKAFLKDLTFKRVNKKFGIIFEVFQNEIIKKCK